jgi:hypothetical protein
MSSKLETDFAAQIERFKLPPPVPEFKIALCVGRQYRWDFAWPQYMLAVELHGLVVVRGYASGSVSASAIVRGGHGTVPGMIRDMDKQNTAVLLGWSQLVFAQNHVKSGAAIQVLQRVLAARGWNQ